MCVNPDTLLVGYKHIIHTHCIFEGTFEPCVTQLFSTLHNNDLLWGFLKREGTAGDCTLSCIAM